MPPDSWKAVLAGIRKEWLHKPKVLPDSFDISFLLSFLKLKHFAFFNQLYNFVCPKIKVNYQSSHFGWDMVRNALSIVLAML